MQHRAQSEFGGRDTKTGLGMNPLRGRTRLTPSDRLMVNYRTGTDNPDEKPDRKIWLGGDPHHKVVVPRSRIPR